MKKSKLLLFTVISALSFGSLVGCNVSVDIKSESSNSETNVSSNISSSESKASSQQIISSSSERSNDVSSQLPVESEDSSSSSTSQGESSEITTYDWSEEDLVIFKEHLYDYYLPHPNKPGVTLRALEGVSQGVMIGGCTFLEGELASYASMYRAMGWTGGPGSEFGSNIPRGAQYIFTRYFDTPNGKRYLIVTFGCMEYDESGTAKASTKGLFSLEAVDPYLYSYDDVMNSLAKVVDIQGIANDLPPELPGVTSYFIQPNEADGSILLTMTIDSTSAESDFTTLLRTNGWTIVSGADGSTMKSAISPNGVLKVSYSYDTTQKVLTLTVNGVDSWNSSLVENFFRKYNQTPVAIKPLNVEGASYALTELPDNEASAQAGTFETVYAMMSVYGDKINKATFDEYVKSWKNDGYVVNTTDNSSNIMKMIGEDSLYQVMVSFIPASDGAKNGIMVMFAATGRKGSQRSYLYPREQLATFLNGLTDSLPMIDARNAGYVYQTSGDVFALMIYSDEEGAFNAISNYKTTLRQSGYEPDASNANKFLSRNGEISVELNSTSGIITMVINRIDTTPQVTEWPAAEINQAITGHISPSITDTLPELTISEATNCYVNTNFSSGFEIVIEGLGSSSNAYKSVFKSNGWVEDPFYQYDNNTVGALISPNNQLAAHFYVDVTGVDTSDLVIMVSSYSQPLYNPWPAEMINEYLEEDGVTKDIVPGFDKALYFRHAGNAKEFKVFFYTSNNEVALQLYNDSLKMSGYNIDSELKGYVSANRELLIKTGIEKLDGFDYVMVYAKYIGPEPEVKPVYKIVGTMNDWSYTNSQIGFVDFPDASLAAQEKATFDVEAGDEFKVYDDSGDTGWLGYEIAEPNDDFVNNGGNIKVKNAGTVELYLKTYKDSNQKKIALVFTPAPTPWPSEQLEEFFGDDVTAIPEVSLGEKVSYEIKQAEVIDGKKIMKVTAYVALSGEEMNAYKTRFARANGYTWDEETNVLSREGYPDFLFSNNGDSVDIWVTYEKPAEPEVVEWPGEEIAGYFGEVFDAIPKFEIEDNTSFEITQRVDNDINKFMVINADASLDGDQLARYINAFAETYGYTRNTDNQHYYSENAGYPEYMFSNNGTSVDIYVIYVKPQTEPVEWPLEEIDAIVEDAWEIENIVPIIEDECITDIQIEDYDGEEDVSFTIVISNGAELKAAYESLLEDAFICNEAGVWVAVSGTMQIGVAESNDDLFIFVNFRQKAGDYDRWPEVQLIDFFDNDCDFYPWSAKTEALYNIEYSPEDADYQHADVTVTVNNDGAEEAMNDAVVAILREFGAETGSPLAYVYDEETGILYSPSEEAPTYEFALLDENNFTVLVSFVKPEIEPELVEWPEEDINAIMVDKWESDDVIPSIVNESTTEIVVVYDEDDNPDTFAIRLYGAGDLTSAYEELMEMNEDFTYDEGEDFWVSSSGKTAVNFYESDGDFWIDVGLIEQEEPLSSYEAAIAELHDYFGEDIIFPDLEIEDAVEYSVSDSDTLVITFAEGTDLDEKWEEIKTLIENSDAYHYFRISQWYENAEQGMSCGPYIDIPTNSVCIYFSGDQFCEEDYYLGYLSPSDDHYIGNGGAAFSYDSEVEISGKTYTQYIAEGVYFYEDLWLTVYNGETKQEFRVQIDEWSLDKNYDDYLEWDEEAQAYAVKQPFTGTFYLKIRYGEDILYIGFYN